ncbi:autotransporter-associated beta strand repeat-containing protein [Lacunisphaera limnophila]|nr:autotransporter-associated beta strand repeat-containing protein [Lacunisphaera limnophila]
MTSHVFAQFTYTEDFKNDTAAGWVLNPAGNSTPAPILTSGAAPRAGDPEFGDATIDPLGAGWLRLTNDTTNTHNAVYFDTPIPSAGNSVNITFGMNMWGGNDYNQTGADGITFFLYDASKPFVVGADGGSIGYAQKDFGTIGTFNPGDQNGMNGGWVGIALDAYGNYSRAAEGRQGGTAGGGALNPNTVVARGPGDGVTGYNYLAGTGDRDYTDTGSATVLEGGDGTVPDLPYTMAFSDATARPNQSTQYRNVSITFDENSQLTVSMQFGEDGLWYDVLDVDLSSFVRPEQLKMGFAAGTGAGTQVYEIGGLLSVTATAGSGNFVWDNGEGASFKIWGTGDNDPLNWAGNTNPTLKSNVLFNSTYVTTAQSIDVTGSDKVIKNMYFSGDNAYTLSTSDQRRLIFDSDSVGVPTSINLTNDVVNGNASHQIAMDVQMNKNLEVNNNLSAVTPFTISGNIDTNGNALAMKGVGQSVLSGVISGNGTLGKWGTGTTILSGAGANTYTGATTVHEGILQIEKNTALGSTAAGTTVNAGGTLALNGTGLTVAEGLTLTGTGSNAQGALFNATGANTWTGTVALAGDASIGTAAATTLTVAGVVSGAAGNDLTKTGAGTLVLSGANTYTGSTTLAAGTLAISNENNLGANPGSFNAAQLNLDGGTLRTQTSAVTINDTNRGVTLGAAGGTFETLSDLTIANVVDGSGTLAKTGAGVLTLSGTNTHSGAVALNQGTLTASGGSALGDTSAVTIANGATLNVSGSSETVGSIAGVAGSAVNLGSGATTLTVGGNNASTTFAGVVAGGASANLLKTGSGTLTMSGANTFDGNLQVNQGTVALGANNVFDNDTSLVLSGGTFATHSGGTGFSDTFNDLSLLASSGMDFGSLGGVATFGSAVRTNGILTIYGWAGDISGGGASQLIFSSGPTGFTGSLDQIVFDGYGAGATRLASGEIVPLTGTVYTWNATGATWNNNANWDSTPDGTPGGTNHTAIFGSALTSNLTLSLGANRTLGYLVFNDNNNVTLQNNTLNFNVTAGAAQVNLSNTGSATLSSAITLSDNLTFNQNSTGTLTVSGAITNATGTNNITVGGSGGTTISGAINTGAGTLTKTGTGALTLSSITSTFTGAITVNGGVLSIDNELNLGSTASTADLTLNGGTLNVSSGTVTVATSLRNLVLGTGGGTLDTDGNLIWDNGISGTGSLTKTGTGTLTLLDPTTFTGAFNINEGLVVFDGGDDRLDNSVAVAIALGATLDIRDRTDTIGSLAGAGTLTNTGAASDTITFGGLNTDTTFSGTLSDDADGTLNLTKQGTGRTIISGASTNTYDGVTTISAGTLNVQKDSGLGTTTGGTTVGGTGAALELQHNTGLTIGTEALSLAGTGVDTNGALRNVSGTNSFAGAITLTADTEIQSDAGSLTLTGAINGSAASRTLTIDGAGNISATNAIGANISTLTKNGTGTLTLSGTNLYTGNTTLNGGTTAIANNAALGDATGTTTVNGGATLALSGGISVAENLTTFGQGVSSLGAIRNTGGSNTLSGTITLSSETYLGVDAGTTLTATGAIGGTAGLSKQGTGTLILDSATANTYDGTTAIAAGTLEVRRSTSLADVNATTIANDATLRLNGSGLALDENITVTGSGVSAAGAIQNTGGDNSLTGVITMTGNTVISATTGTTLTLTDGSLAGDFNLVKTGAGGLTLANTAATYSGTTTIRDGTLTVAADAPLSANGALGNSASVVQVGDGSTGGGANLALLAGNASGGIEIDRQISVNNQGSTATLGGTNTSGTNTFTGNIALGRSTTLAAAGSGTVAYTGVISGVGPVVTTGTTTSNTILSGANTFTGAVTASSGTLTLTNAAALGTTAAGTTVSSGATLALSGGLALASGEALTLNGTGVAAGTGALHSASGDNTVAGPVTLASTSTLSAATGTTLGVTGALSGTGGLSTAGAGNITLSGTNTFTGATAIAGTGLVTLNGSGSGALGSTTSLTLAGSSILSLGASDQINNSANLTLSGGTLRLNGYQDVLNNIALTASTTSVFDYLNDNSLLRFTGTASVGGTSQLTIDNWAGDPTTGGSSNYGLLFNTQAQALALENNVLFNGWTTVGNNAVIANGIYWEIVPIVTVREWQAAGNGDWDTGGNWAGGQPDGAGQIAMLGNNITAGTTATVNTFNGGGADPQTIGKLIIDTTGDRNYTVSGSDRLDFDVASGTTQLIVAGNGTHTISSAVRVNDDMVLTNDGTDTTALTISGAIDLFNGASSDLTVSGSGRTAITGAINDSTDGAALLKTGSGTLALSGTSSYTGTTTLRNGTLEIAGSATNSTNGNLGNAASAVVINDTNTALANNTSFLMTDADGGSTMGRAITVNSQGATTTLGGTNTSGTNTFSGTITLNKGVTLTAAAGGTVAFTGALDGNTGTQNITKSGDGTVLLSNTGNDFNGTTTITAGTLRLGAAGVITDGSAVSVASGATLDLNTFSETIGSLAGAGTVNLASGTQTLTTGGNNGTTEFSGVIQDNAGTLALVKNGTGALTLSGAGANTFDGDVTINAGTLIAAKNTALGATSGNTTVATDATLALTGGITIAAGEDLDLAGSVAPNIASLANYSGNNTYAGNVTMSGAAGDDVKYDAAGGSQLTITGAVGESGGSKDFAKTGTGTLVLGNANTYSGSTNVAAGTLVVANNAALGTATVASTDDTAVQIGATLAFQNNVAVSANEAITLNATAAPTAASLKNNADTNTVAGAITLSGGANTGVILDSNTGSSLTLSGAITPVTPSNNNFVTKTGDGSLTLAGTGANTFQGAFNVNSGTVVLNKTAGVNATGTGALNIGDSTGGTNSAIVQLNASNQINNTTAVTIATDGKLDLLGNSDAIGALTMAGGSVTATGAGTLTLGGNLTFNGIGANTATITANVDLGGNRIVQVGNNASAVDTDLTINGVVSGTGSSFTKTDLGTLRLTGDANTFTGNFQVTDGTVVLDKTAVAGVKGNATGVSNSTVTIGDNFRGANTAILEVSGDGLFADQTSDQIANSATLVMNSDGKFRMARTSGTAMFTETVGAIAGSGNIDLGYYSLIAGGNNASTSFSGTLVGDSTALFTKAGSGTLTIDSNLGYNGGLDVTGGTLAFNVDNAFSGAVNIFAGTTLKLSDADLSISNLNLVGSGSITLDFSGTSTLSVANLTIAAGITVNVINWTNATDYFFAQNWAGAVFDTTATTPMNQVVFAGFTGNQTKWQSYDDQITPVPEPSTYGAMLVGAMGALLGYRRWRKARPAARK